MQQASYSRRKCYQHLLPSPDKVVGIPYVYEVFTDHIQLLQGVWVLWVGHVAQVLHTRKQWCATW